MALTQIRRLLIANRGEIAVRIIRACRELGIESVQVHTEADRESLAVRMADQAVCIGEARSAESYLNANLLLSAASAFKANAIHPGYGFLSENAQFAEGCDKEGVAFVGPSPRVIRLMGDKATARRTAMEAGVPVTPGSDGIVSGVTNACEIAKTIGYPVLLKAAAGGGGRGMRVVHDPADMSLAYSEATREAKAAFGDDSMYLEKYLTRIRHIEIQVLGDGREVIHLGERDCSMQRRNQKLVEESPSPVLSSEQRKAIGEAALRLCRHVGYTNAGTIEFILDQDSGHFYFMEMNTRIQVEHPVTEMVTGIDLVKAQIEIAAGMPLALSQDQIRIDGHAIECRINAEDVARNFMPSPGRIQGLQLPGGIGVRVDTHISSGYAIPPYYDSLLAKLVCWGRTREESRIRMLRALGELRVEGVSTNADFQRRLLEHPDFQSGAYNTRYVEDVFLTSSLAAA